MRDTSLESGVRVESSIETLDREWSSLAEAIRAPPFLYPGWSSAWWAAFGNGRLEILTVRRGGRLVGVLPIEGRRGAWRSPTNWHTPEFGLVAEDDEARVELIDALLARGRSVSLAFLDAEGRDLAGLGQAATRARCLQLVRLYERSPYVELDGDWDSYERTLGTNLRRNVNRSLKRLADLGCLELDVDEGDDELDERLTELFTVEALGWKGRPGTAIISEPATRRFYAAVARWATARGSLRLVVLRLDGRPIAFHFALEEVGVYYPLKGGFDPDFGQFSPGQLIIRASLQRAFDLGLVRYEFLGGDEPYKRSWTDSFHERMLFQAFFRTPRGISDWLAYAYGRPLVKRRSWARKRE